MYLRRNRRTADGQTYEYWTLVESVRTARGPRQHTVATLGKLPGLDRSVHCGWADIDALLAGEPPAGKQLPLPGVASIEAPDAPCWREVDVRGVSVERVREFGEVYLALALWRRLGLDTALREVMSRVTLFPEDGCGFSHGIVGGNTKSDGRSVVSVSGRSVVGGRGRNVV